MPLNAKVFVIEKNVLRLGYRNIVSIRFSPSHRLAGANDGHAERVVAHGRREAELPLLDEPRR